MVRQPQSNSPGDQHSLDDIFSAKSPTFKPEATDSFSSADQKAAEEKITNKPPTLMQRKMRRFKKALGGSQTIFLQGFKMGALVGGCFGGIMGLYYAVTYKTFYLMPLAALGSGCSFGFFMGIGMFIRTQLDAEGSGDEYKL